MREIISMLDFGWKVTWERVLYRSFSIERLVPNMIVGVLLGLVGYMLLKWHSKNNEGYILLAKKQIVLFISFLVVAVVLVSPLLPRGGMGILEILSVLSMIFILAITSYMDKQTGFFVHGYLVVGLVVNFVLFILAIATGKVNVSKSLFIVLVCCMLTNGFLHIIRAYTIADMLLIQMALFGFSILDFGNLLFAFVMCVMFACVYDVARALFMIPRIKEMVKNKKFIQLPFTQCIYVGVIVTIFYIS